MEAVLQGIPAVAISQVCKDSCKDVIDSLNWELAKKVAKDVVTKILNSGYPLDDRKFLNINVPPIDIKDYKGVKITHAGRREYGFDAEVHINPRGLEYYWIGLPKIEWKKTTNPLHDYSDIEAIRDNFVSITPIHLDMTHYNSIKRLEEWI
jgi:5'-nucleotidase